MAIIVVGAGIIGLHIAEALSGRGENVTVIDPDIPGQGTSTSSFAWVNANRNPHPAYYGIKVAGMEEHRSFASRQAGDRTYFEPGGIQLTNQENEDWVLENVGRLANLGYPSEWLTVEQAHDRLGLEYVPPETTRVAWFRGEGYLLPNLHMQQLASVLHNRGVELVRDTVRSVADATVTTLGGQVQHADRIVLATGRWTKELAATAKVDLPIVNDLAQGSPTVGVLGDVITAESAITRMVVHSPHLNLRPGANGHIVMQALDLNTDYDPCDPANSAERLRPQLAERFERLTNHPLEAQDISIHLGLRALPVDGHPIVGFIDSHAGIYAAVAHGGITLGPLLGRLVTEELLDQRRDPLLAAFGPERFTPEYLSSLEPYTTPNSIGQQ